jgi:molybdate transport system regulatory protein
MRIAPRRRGKRAKALARGHQDEARQAVLTIRIDFGDCGNLGPGKVALMELISKHGSISAAGKEMGMSYRRAWLLVDSINSAMEKPAVAAVMGGRQGGGAAVTPVGERIIEIYRSIEDRARTSARDEFRAVEKIVRKAKRKSA